MWLHRWFDRRITAGNCQAAAVRCFHGTITTRNYQSLQYYYYYYFIIIIIIIIIISYSDP